MATPQPNFITVLSVKALDFIVCRPGTPPPTIIQPTKQPEGVEFSPVSAHTNCTCEPPSRYVAPPQHMIQISQILSAQALPRNSSSSICACLLLVRMPGLTQEKIQEELQKVVATPEEEVEANRMSRGKPILQSQRSCVSSWKACIPGISMVSNTSFPWLPRIRKP